MICWGSWANTQKLTQKASAFQLFYWDYTIGVFIWAIIAAFTMGSMGHQGRAFALDFSQATEHNLMFAFAGGVLFNIANILLVLAIDIAGMAVAFPLAIGLALVLGVIANYWLAPLGSMGLLAVGVILIIIAMLFSAKAYQRLGSSNHTKTTKGIIIAIVCGVLMGFFYPFVADSLVKNYVNPEAGALTPYTALVMFSVGVLVCNIFANTLMMYKPLTGKPTTYSAYFKQSFWTHCVGILGGIIWSVGTMTNLLAANKAGFAISYGLGQGATMIAALWGVFIWREFKHAKNVNLTLTLMFVCYLLGLIAIIVARYW
jgi:glucose uptake protein